VEEEARDEVGERWSELVRRARLHHPDDAGLAAELAGAPVPNGVGGEVARVGLAAGQLLPEDLREAAGRVRRVLRVDAVFVRQVDTDTVDLHMYRGRPLAEPVGWRWLAGHQPVSGEWVAVGATVTAQPAALRWRHSVLWAGLTGSGKTTGQLALLHSVTAVRRIPVHLLVLDNRGEDEGGSELAWLEGVRGVVYRNRTSDAWELVCRALDIMAGRQAAKGGLGELQPSDDSPLVRLLVTELPDVLSSRPPAGVADWAGYSRGWFDKRPSAEDWRAMLVEHLARIARKGRDVCVCADLGAQVAQVEVIPTKLRATIGQRVLFRVMNHSDIAPALGDASGAPAHEIPDWQAGAGFLRVDGSPVFFRAAHVPPEELDEAVVWPLQAYGRRVLYAVGG